MTAQTRPEQARTEQARPEEGAAKQALRRALRRLWTAYDRTYAGLCGRHPHERPWHFQWLSTRELKRDLAQALPLLRGRVLDLGCGAQPYRALLSPAADYTGADVQPGQGVDALLTPGEPLPFPDGCFDAILCTQVLEHVEDLGGTVAEMRRVLRPGGLLLVSVPAIYQVHGAPHDYRRFTEHGLASELRGFRIQTLSRHGGIGSALAVLLLNFIELRLGLSLPGWAFKAACLPLWVALSLAVNLLALAGDGLDGTGAFAHNLFAVARRDED